MRSPSIVALEPWPDALLKLADRGLALEVNVLASEASPEPLNEHVVQPPPLAVHTQGDPQLFEPSRPFRRGERATLIGVEDLRKASALRHRDRQGFFPQRRVHRVAHRPPKHLAAVPGQHCTQVGLPLRHRDMRNV
jgi:hypothetical protein